MSSLVIAEHDNKTLNTATLNAVAAAQAIGGDIHVLVAGENCGAVAEAASKVAGVAKTLYAESAACANQLAENVAATILNVASEYFRYYCSRFGRYVRSTNLCG